MLRRQQQQREAEQLRERAARRRQQRGFAEPQIVREAPPEQTLQEWAFTTNITAADVVASSFMPEEQPPQESSIDQEIGRITDDIEVIERDLFEAEDAGDTAEQDYLIERRDRLYDRLEELRRLRIGPVGSADQTRLLRQSPQYVDFPINGQKTQICLKGDGDSPRRFNFMIQTNRGTYRRKIAQITGDSVGLNFRRVVLNREMTHGFKLAERPDGYYVVLERKEANDDTR
jgi:hypothetical protein